MPPNPSNMEVDTIKGLISPALPQHDSLKLPFIQVHSTSDLRRITAGGDIRRRGSSMRELTEKAEICTATSVIFTLWESNSKILEILSTRTPDF
ncbi:unnamed protein product [Sphagnum compactum]